jgi:hypothetical protein
LVAPFGSGEPEPESPDVVAVDSDVVVAEPDAPVGFAIQPEELEDTLIEVSDEDRM